MSDNRYSIDPRAAELAELLARIPSDEPIVMLNLLRFHDRAQYADGDRGLTGREAYQRYSELVVPFLSAVDGQPQWLAAAHAPLIAPPGEDWHKVMLVRYPSIEHFVTMLRNPDYQAITEHRTAALMDSRLIACTEDK